jgi:hypothetical protein
MPRLLAVLSSATPGSGHGTNASRAGLLSANGRVERAGTCDLLIGRLSRLAAADPPLLLQSHPVTRQLLADSSPTNDPAYKHQDS